MHFCCTFNASKVRLKLFSGEENKKFECRSKKNLHEQKIKGTFRIQIEAWCFFPSRLSFFFLSLFPCFLSFLFSLIFLFVFYFISVSFSFISTLFPLSYFYICLYCLNWSFLNYLSSLSVLTIFPFLFFSLFSVFHFLFFFLVL